MPPEAAMLVGENGLEMIDMSGEAPWNELRRKS
jgi:hypothetical protein